MPQPKSSRSTSTRARKPAASRATTTRAKTTRTATKAARAPAKTTRTAAKPSTATSKAETAALDNLKALRTTLGRGVVVTQGHIKDALDDAVKAGRLSRKEATELARNIVAAGRKQADGFRKDIDQVLSRKR